MIEIHCRCYNTLPQFPENSYVYDNIEDAIKCISDLLRNKMSGIYSTEIIDHRFDKKES